MTCSCDGNEIIQGGYFKKTYWAEINNARVDITGWTMRLLLRTATALPSDPPALDLSSPADITIADQTADIGGFSVELLRADTLPLAPGDYVGDVVGLRVGDGQPFYFERGAAWTVVAPSVDLP